MHDFVNKYVNVFKKPIKAVEQSIKHRIEQLDPEKPITPIPHYRQKKMNGRGLK